MKLPTVRSHPRNYYRARATCGVAPGRGAVSSAERCPVLIRDEELPPLVLDREFVPVVEGCLSFGSHRGCVGRVDADGENAVFLAERPRQIVEALQSPMEHKIAQERAVVISKNEHDGSFAVEITRQRNLLTA